MFLILVAITFFLCSLSNIKHYLLVNTTIVPLYINDAIDIKFWINVSIYIIPYKLIALNLKFIFVDPIALVLWDLLFVVFINLFEVFCLSIRDLKFLQ